MEKTGFCEVGCGLVNSPLPVPRGPLPFSCGPAAEYATNSGL